MSADPSPRLSISLPDFSASSGRGRTWRNALALLAGAALWSGAPSAWAQTYTPPTNNRVSFNFNHDWKFIKQDVSAASATSFNDSAWGGVNLPHTWNDDKYREWVGHAEGEPDKADPMRPSGEYFGKAWYRKHFKIPPAYAGRKVLLEFQGIGRMGKFWVNGTLLGTHENGIGPAGIDITPYVNFSDTQENVIAVRVDNDQNSKSEEYPNNVPFPYGVPFNVNYGGINRDVTLHITDKVYQTLPLYRNLGTVGTYVYAKPETIDTLAKTATLTVDAEVKNDTAAAASVTLEAKVVGLDGVLAYSLPLGTAQSVPAGAKAHVLISQALSNVKFWSPDFPYLYQVYSILRVGGNVVDVQKTSFGFRKFGFGRTFGLEVNGHPLYLDGYAPRSTMEWAAVGLPPDWMTEYDFKLIRESNGNFLRPMHGAPRLVQVQAADKYGVVMVAPAVSTENDPDILTAGDQTQWEMKKDIMRDVMIYFRNHPSVLFWEGCNGGLSAQHEQEILDLRLLWDPFGGRRTGSRTNAEATDAIREFSSTMDGSGQNKYTPLWDAEYARAEGPRRVWDVDSPMLNPRWNGVTANTITNPATGTTNNTAAKYLKGGYFYIAAKLYQDIGLNVANGEAICDYLDPVNPGYFRLNSSEDMMIENVCKYWGRYVKSVYIQPPGVSNDKGVMVGGAKIIWADSYTDGRMKDMEVARTSGAVDAVRLPKETFYGLQVAQADPATPMLYMASHWNYPTGTTRKAMFVVSNLPKVKLITYNSAGQQITDYGEGVTNILPAGTFGDMVNHYVFKFTNVAWQPGSVKAIAYKNSPTESGAISQTVATVGAPAKLRITPVVGPQGWKADGSDIAMFDVEVLDANNERCPTFEDKVTFTWSGQGTFLGGYNSGKRYSTHLPDDPSTTYNLNLECGINRVFARATRTAGSFTLNVSGTGLTSAPPVTVTSASVPVTNGLSAAFPQTYDHVAFVSDLTEPDPSKEADPPAAPSNAPNPALPGAFRELDYTGQHAAQATVDYNIQGNELAYMDSSSIRLPATLPRYLIGSDFVRAFYSDRAETSSTDQYQFNMNRWGYVYQVVDAANGMPKHNSTKYNWVKLPEQITVNGRAMKIYKSKLLAPYENVYLACNGHDNNLSGFDSALGFTPASNMYLLFVTSAEQELQLPSPGNTATATDSQGTNTPDKAIDANPATRWNAASGGTKVFNLDLGRNVKVGGYQINWNSAATKYSQYKVEISPTGTSDWTTSLDMSANVNLGADEYRVPSDGTRPGRYLRISITYVSGGGWPSINDLKVYGVLDSATAPTVPTVTSPLTASGQGGYNFSYTIAASGGATGYQAQGLPVGWTLNGNTGVISGTTMESGTKVVTVNGVNNAGAGGALLTVTLAAPPPKPVVSNGSFTTLAGVAISSSSTYTISATNLNYTPVSYAAEEPANLGVTISSSTGKLSGTPKWPDTYLVPIHATNPGGTGDGTLTLIVTANGSAPTISSSGTVNCTAFVALSPNYTITTTGGPANYYDATGLPVGLSRNTTTGVISGTPTVPGSYVVEVSAKGMGGKATKNVTFNVAVNPNAPNITNTVTTITGNAGIAIANYQVATNPAATNFTITPALPLNLTMSASGLISGTPTGAAVGETDHVITASNSVGSDTSPLHISIRIAVSPPVLTMPVNAVGVIGTFFSLQPSATNNPTTWTKTSGSFPGGVTLNPSTGQISGTPSGATGNYTATITAGNAGGPSAAKTITIGISPAGSEINIALNCATDRSSIRNTNGASAFAVDGITTSAWESDYTDNEWIRIDLGSPRVIHSIVLNWQNAAGKNYKLQTSNSAMGPWTDFVPPIVGNAATGVLPPYNGNATAQFVQMIGTLRKATAYGYRLFEFQVFGPASGSVSAPVITSSGTAPGTVGQPFYYKIQATNSPTGYTLTGGTVPAGLNPPNANGEIIGTPTASGTFGRTMNASNPGGTGSAALSIQIAPAGSDSDLAASIAPVADSTQAPNVASNLTDGSATSRWAANDGAFPHNWVIDLTANKVLSKVQIDWLNPTNRYYQYKIETATNSAGPWTMFADQTANTTFGGPAGGDVNTATARYVRVTVTGSSSGFASAYEFRVFGH